MFLIYKDTTSVLKNWTSDKGLMLLPNNNVSQFIVKSLNKYNILDVDENIIKLIEKKDKKNISLLEINKFLKEEELTDIYQSPNKGQVENIFNKTLRNIEESKDIYTSIEAFVLFIEWINKNNHKFTEEVYFEGDISEIINSYGYLKAREMDLYNLDKLLKLFCYFYAKKIEKADIYKIGQFQNKIKKGNLSFFKEVTEINKIIENTYNNQEKIPSNNIFNKILEMLENLENLKYGFYKKENSKNILLPLEKTIQKNNNDFKKMLGL